jgi:hypothetical protein
VRQKSSSDCTIQNTRIVLGIGYIKSKPRNVMIFSASCSDLSVNNPLLVCSNVLVVSKFMLCSGLFKSGAGNDNHR